MLSRTTTCALATLALGFGGVLLPPSAQAAEGTSTRTEAAAVAAERQAALVAGEDQRLMTALARGEPTAQNPHGRRKPFRVTGSGPYTLVLTPRRAAYTFDELRRLAPDTLVPQGKGSFLLRENIVVAAGATLAISPSRPLAIKLSSGPDGFVSLVTIGGRLQLNGTAAAPISLESWDESRGRPDTDVSDGRAYVRASGQLVVAHVAFSRLGFWSGRTGGVSVVGAGTTPVNDLDAAAVADTKEAGDPVAEAGSGSGSGKSQLLPAGKLPSAAQTPNGSFGTRISDSTMTGNTFGLFVTGNSGARIENTAIRKSLVNGLVLHRDVDSASVTNVRVEASGSDGVVVSRKVEATVLTQLVVKQNGRDGIVLAGRPLASGPSASGSSTRAFGNNVLTASQSIDNGRIGIHVIGGTAVRVQGNTVSGGRSGIVVSDGASDIDVDSNRVAGVVANGIQIRESLKVTVSANAIRNAQTGIHVRNSSGSLRQNSTSAVTLHGITFVGRVDGSAATDNRLAGSGTSAIDTVRVTGERAPKLEANDASGWSRTVTGDSLVGVLLHPLTVVWMLVALLLLALSRPRRDGSGLPYRADPLAHAAVGSTPSPDPTREREVPVFVLPERRVPVPVSAGSPALLSPPIPASGPQWEHEVEPERRPEPQPVGRVGHAVIDLAIREARLNPAAPRRRRVNGR